MDIILTVIAYLFVAFAILYDIFTLIAIRKRKKAGVLEIRRPIGISVVCTAFCLALLTLFTMAKFSWEADPGEYKYYFVLCFCSLSCVSDVLWDTWEMTLEGDKIGVRKFFRVKYYSLQDIIYDRTMVYYRGKKIFTLYARYYEIPDAFEWQLQQREKFQISQIKF